MQSTDFVPLWAFFLGAIGVMILAIESGFRLGERRRPSGEHEPEAPLAPLVGATLGLLAFMLAFTFNIAMSRFDDRRTSILAEANAIGTTYLRADFLDEPARKHVKKLLREYLMVRVNGTSPDRVAQAISKSESLQQELWSEATAAGRAHATPITGLFVSSLNEVIDMHAKRVTLGLHARVPQTVWTCLFIVTILSMLGVGYYCGLAGYRSWTESIVLVTTFSVVCFWS